MCFVCKLSNKTHNFKTKFKLKIPRTICKKPMWHSWYSDCVMGYPTEKSWFNHRRGHKLFFSSLKYPDRLWDSTSFLFKSGLLAREEINRGVELPLSPSGTRIRIDGAVLSFPHTLHGVHLDNSTG